MNNLKYFLSILAGLNFYSLFAQNNNFSNENGFVSVSGGFATPFGSFAGKSKNYELENSQLIKVQQNGGFATLGYNFKVTYHSYNFHKNIPLTFDAGVLVNPIDKNTLRNKTSLSNNYPGIKSDNWNIPYLTIGIGYRFIIQKFSLHATINGGISYCAPPQATFTKDLTIATLYSKIKYQGVINGIYGGSIGLRYTIGRAGLLLETVFINTIDQNYKCTEEYGNSMNDPSLSHLNSSFTLNGNATLGIHSLLVNIGAYYSIYKK